MLFDAGMGQCERQCNVRYKDVSYFGGTYYCDHALIFFRINAKYVNIKVFVPFNVKQA